MHIRVRLMLAFISNLHLYRACVRMRFLVLAFVLYQLFQDLWFTIACLESSTPNVDEQVVKMLLYCFCLFAFCA